jgi:hypothetical protein
MLIGTLFIILKLWKQSRSPSTDEGIKNILYIYTTDYYSAIKNKRIMLLTSKWMKLERIMLSKVN